MSTSNNNSKNILKNKNKIFQISADVHGNEMLVFQSRSLIEENRLMILSNYTAAFLGNRQLANNNTESIFENRSAILSNIEAQTEIESDFIDAQKNKASLDLLKHKSELNTAS